MKESKTVRTSRLPGCFWTGAVLRYSATAISCVACAGIAPSEARVQTLRALYWEVLDLPSADWLLRDDTLMDPRLVILHILGQPNCRTDATAKLADDAIP